MTDNEIIKALENEVRLTEYVDSNYCDGLDNFDKENPIE